MKAQASLARRSLVPVVFSPEFTAVCDTCGKTTMWFKANKVVQGEPGMRPLVEKGFKCSACETFEDRVLDTRGRVQVRQA